MWLKEVLLALLVREGIPSVPDHIPNDIYIYTYLYTYIWDQQLPLAANGPRRARDTCPNMTTAAVRWFLTQGPSIGQRTHWIPSCTTNTWRGRTPRRFASPSCTFTSHQPKSPSFRPHLWIFQFLRRWSFQAGWDRERVGRRSCPPKEEEEAAVVACRSLPAPNLPSATHAFRPADRYPAEDHRRTPGKVSPVLNTAEEMLLLKKVDGRI